MTGLSEIFLTKLVELELLLDMSYKGDAVGLSLIEEIVDELIKLSEHAQTTQALNNLKNSVQKEYFLSLARQTIEKIRERNGSTEGDEMSVESVENIPLLPHAKLEDLKLIVEMTHAGDVVGCQLIGEQLKELAAEVKGHPLVGLIEELSNATDAPNFLEVVVEFLKNNDNSIEKGDHSGTAVIENNLSEGAQLEVESEGLGSEVLLDALSEEPVLFKGNDSDPFLDIIPQDFLDKLIQGHIQPVEEPKRENRDIHQIVAKRQEEQISLQTEPEAIDVASQDTELEGGAQENSSVSDIAAKPEEGALAATHTESFESSPILVLEDLGDIEPEYNVEGDLEILQEFGTECEEHINSIEQVILESGGGYEKSAIDTIFRGIHSIKGGSAYFNLQEMKKCSHLLEDMLHEVRDGHRPMENRLEQLCLFYLDCQKDALKRYREASARNTPVKRSDDSLRLLMMIRSFDKEVPQGDLKAALPIGDLSPATPKKTEDINVKATEDTKPKEAAHESLVAVESQRTDTAAPAVIVSAESEFHPQAKPQIPKQQDRTVARYQEQKVDQRGTFPTAQKREHLLPNRKPAVTEVEQKRGNQLAKKIASEAAEASKKFVKVDTERLDNLIDLIGEMVVFSSVLVRFCKLHMSDHKDVMEAAHRVEKFSKELQDVGISMRLDPIRGLFQKMQRLVWDTSKRLGKDIVFQMEGEDTELDRNLIDRLADPLMHMVRNSLDHGIESNDEREANGKPRKGTIKLSAYHSGGNVHIKIQDDGKGLDPAKLIAKAIDKGIIEDGKRMSNEEAFQLIFAPGFSTAAQVTDLSGRGVGMDVVRRNVEDLRGRIHIQSVVGEGAAFIIELPLTLAIIEGIQISVGAENFIIPSLSIVEFLRPRRGMISRAMDSAETFFFRGKYLPLFRMSNVYKIDGAIEDPERASIVVLEENGDQFAFLVDTIEGECSTVIKSLGEVFEDVQGVSGGAIMPQGNVVLILDVKSLVRLAQDTNHYVENFIDFPLDDPTPNIIQ